MLRSEQNLLVFAAVVVFMAAGCRSAQSPPKQLLVASAISLRPALDSVIIRYQAIHSNTVITVSYAGSGTLRHQVEYGAPIDVYISASSDHIDSLQAHDHIMSETRDIIASNTLVLVMSVQRAPIRGMFDLPLPGVSHIAIGEPGVVPAGQYAIETLRGLNLLDRVRDKLVFTKDAQQVLVHVRSGTVDVGFVYATDVMASTPVRRIQIIADSLHNPILYEGAVCRQSHAREAAAEFLAYLSSDSAQTVFASHGFLPAGR